MDRGADVNVADKWGNTPLSTAVMASHVACVKRLIVAGADVNVADKEGVTPLMWAANRGSVPIVKLLLERGADPNAKDRVEGERAQDGADVRRSAQARDHRAACFARRENQNKGHRAIPLSAS